MTVREIGPADAPRPKLLEQVQRIRARHYSRRTEKAYVHWIKRYIFFHDKRHPAEMGPPKSRRFSPRSRCAIEAPPPRGTRRSALCSCIARCSRSSAPGSTVSSARSAEHLPVVLTRGEAQALIEALDGVPRLMALLLYGADLRLLECCRLRIQDVDFVSNQITVRDGKGGKDRTTMLPGAVTVPSRGISTMRGSNTPETS